MIWGSPGRQHTWLAVGARSFALLTLVLPLILKNNQLLLLALLATGAVWAAVTAGELLGLPATAILVLDAALIGSIAGLSSPSTTAVLGAMAVPPFTAGLTRGVRGVGLALSAELTTYVVVVTTTAELDQTQGSAAFTWAVTGLGLFASGVLLWAAGFPTGAIPGKVDPAIVHHFALVYLITITVVYGLGIIVLSMFPITRESHQENLRTLAAEMAQAQEPVDMGVTR